MHPKKFTTEGAVNVMPVKIIIPQETLINNLVFLSLYVRSTGNNLKIFSTSNSFLGTLPEPLF